MAQKKEENAKVACIEKTISEINKSKFQPSAMLDLVKHNFKEIEDVFTSKKTIPGLSTGFERLDDFTSGLQNSDLIILAGRPSMGKTALAHNIATTLSSEQGIPVLIFSLESPRNQVAARIISTEARIDSVRIQKGLLGDSEWPRLTEAAGRLAEASLYIVDQPAIINITDIQECSREMKKIAGIKLIILDYIQLMSPEVRRDTRDQEISEITRALKALAMELNIPVIALSQLNRKVEDRPTRRPQLSDLRDSGAIEEDADLIVFIYRDDIYNKADDNPDKCVAELIIGKQRNGRTGMIKLAFFEKFLRFENLGPMESEYPQR